MIMDEETLRVQAVRTLYLEILEREADEAGARSYVESKFTLDEIREQLSNSSEALFLRARKEKYGVIEFITSTIAVSSTPKSEDWEKVKGLGFNRAIVLDDGRPDELDMFDTALYFRHRLEDRSLSFEAITEGITELKKEREGKIFVCCSSGLIYAPAIIRLWFVHQGFDEETSLRVTKSRIKSAIPEAVALGPWHFEAAKTLEGF